MFALPIFSALAPARRVLLAGAGGGFDVFCGLPLYLGAARRRQERMMQTETYEEVQAVIMQWLALRQDVRPALPIPL